MDNELVLLTDPRSWLTKTGTVDGTAGLTISLPRGEEGTAVAGLNKHLAGDSLSQRSACWDYKH